MILKTDQLTYEYGDTIEIHVIIKNDTDSTITLESGCTGGTGIRFNNYTFPNGDHLAIVEREYAPGQQRSFIYSIIPEVLGLPNKDGEHWVFGRVSAMIQGNSDMPGESFSRQDSLIIEAPKYYGGRLNVRFRSDVEESESQALRDSLGVVEILEQWDDYQMWQVKGHSIDSITSAYENDSRIGHISPERLLTSADVTTSTSTSSDDMEEIPQEITLLQNFPNPFNPSTVIPYKLNRATDVTLDVLDIQGRRIETLVNQPQQAGRHEAIWDASDMASGAYLYRLTAGGYVLTKQMILVK